MSKVLYLKAKRVILGFMIVQLSGRFFQRHFVYMKFDGKENNYV